MSRRIKAQKREIHSAVAEGQAIKELNDTWFLHEAKRQRQNLVKLKKCQIVEETESYCGDIDSLSLYFMQAATNTSSRRLATR